MPRAVMGVREPGGAMRRNHVGLTSAARFRVAEVRACERMKESAKLLHLTVFARRRVKALHSVWHCQVVLVRRRI